MSNTYIQEAFRQFYLTEDAEEFSLNVSGPDDSASFLDIINSAEDDETISDVYDLEAEAKEDLKQSYIGKVILDCNVCHSNVFFDKADVAEDESGLVCKDIECPYCMSNEGYTIIGEVKPFAEEGSEELEEPIEDTLDKEDILSDDESEEILDDEESIDIDNEVANEDDIDLEDEDEDEDEELEEEYLKSSEKLDPSKELSEGAKLDKVKELDGNDSISGEETPIDGTKGEGLKSNDEIRGPKYKEFKEACEKPLKEQQGKVDDREFKICSDKDGEICKVTGEGEAKKTIAEFKKQDKKSGRKGTKYTYKEITNESLSESIEDVSITTNDETMTMSTKEDGGIVVETSPKEEIDTIESDILNGDEMIAPLEPETKAEIEDNIEADDEAEDALEDDLFEEEPIDEVPVDEEPVEDIEDFDNESFDELGESYLRRCYENVNSYETSKISQQADGSYLIEGRIGFDSGNVKNTQFVFNKNTDSKGKLKLEGYNNQISKGKKTFKLNCSVEDKTIVCESLNYNYKGKNDLDESVRVYGTVKRKVK